MRINKRVLAGLRGLAGVHSELRPMIMIMIIVIVI